MRIHSSKPSKSLMIIPGPALRCIQHILSTTFLSHVIYNHEWKCHIHSIIILVYRTDTSQTHEHTPNKLSKCKQSKTSSIYTSDTVNNKGTTARSIDIHAHAVGSIWLSWSPIAVLVCECIRRMLPIVYSVTWTDLDVYSLIEMHGTFNCTICIALCMYYIYCMMA